MNLLGAPASPRRAPHEKHVYDAMKDVPLTARDKHWFEGKNLPVPGANDGKAPSVAAG